VPGDDGFPVQCVGLWVQDKYSFLERYLVGTRYARKKYSDNNNSVYIDLFSGPGKCVVKNKGVEIENGALRVLLHQEIPFSEYYYFDVIQENTDALRSRIGNKPGCIFQCCDSNDSIGELVQELLRKPYRYHFVYLDPFGPDALPFSTIAELSRLEHLDLFIHFPIGAIRRNLPLWKSGDYNALDKFLGTNSWRVKLEEMRKGEKLHILLDLYKDQLLKAGFPEEGLRMADSDLNTPATMPIASVKNSMDVELYVLVLASKREIALRIWNSVLKIEPCGQRKMF